MIITLVLFGSLQAIGQGRSVTLEIPEISTPSLFNAPACECRYNLLSNPHLSIELADVVLLGKVQKTDPGGHFQRYASATFNVEAMWKLSHPTFMVRYPTIDQACSTKFEKDKLYIVTANDDYEGRYVTSSCSVLPYNHSEARAIIALLGTPQYEASWEVNKQEKQDKEPFSFPNPLNIFKW